MNVNRVKELDGLRGLAAFGVVLYHFVYHYNRVYGHSFTVYELFSYGFYGVHLFFMISGFVIYWTISSVNSPFQFIWSRFTRLYPTFWCAVLITFLFVTIVGNTKQEVDILTFFANLTMVHEYFGFKHVDGAYWTLTLELAFYFWVLMIFSFGFIKKIEMILVIWVIIGAILTAPFLNIDVNNVAKKFFLLQYIELFAAGVCFYKFKQGSHTMHTKVLFIFTLIAIYIENSIQTAVGLSVFYIVFFFIIKEKLTVFSNKYLLYLGSISYSLYLIHQNIGYTIINKAYYYQYNPYLAIIFAILFSLFLAHYINKIVEKPSLKYLRSIYK